MTAQEIGELALSIFTVVVVFGLLVIAARTK